LTAHWVNTLRRENLSLEDFRRLTQRLAWILAAEAGDCLPREDLVVQTPLAKAKGQQLTGDVLLVPVLRAGLSLLPAFLDFYPKASVGFVGLKRDEATAVARCYYKNLPPVSATTYAFVLEPMLATGGSAAKAVHMLVDAGVAEERIIVVSVISAPDGVALFKESYPKVRLLIAMQDDGLSPMKFIVPGLGDFGDRYFGTPPKPYDVE
ncbi:MAG: uracil phosphoribosyltransferase, partial [Chlamydiia bacterium]|nr:uracil phosphoribosyltransferase [Chlamydiia bacterium]